MPPLRHGVRPGVRRDGRERALRPPEAPRGARGAAPDLDRPGRRRPNAWPTPCGRWRSTPTARGPAVSTSRDSKPGGFSGRRHTFLLGLDESKHPGADLEDPVLLDSERRGINRALAPLALPLYRDRPRESARALRVVRRPPVGSSDRQLLELEPAQPRPAERAVPVSFLPRAPPCPFGQAGGRLHRPSGGPARRRRIPAGRGRRARRHRVVALAPLRGRARRGGRRRRIGRARGLSAPRRRPPRRGGARVRGVHDLRRLGPRGNARARPARQRRAPVRLAARDPRAVPVQVLPEARPADRAAQGDRARHDRVARRHDGGLAAARGLPPLLRAHHGGRREAGDGSPRRPDRDDRRGGHRRLARKGSPGKRAGLRPAARRHPGGLPDPSRPRGGALPGDDAAVLRGSLRPAAGRRALRDRQPRARGDRPRRRDVLSRCAARSTAWTRRPTAPSTSGTTRPAAPGATRRSSASMAAARSSTRCTRWRSRRCSAAPASRRPCRARATSSRAARARASACR